MALKQNGIGRVPRPSQIWFTRLSFIYLTNADLRGRRIFKVFKIN
jgi:hypothetical protein